MAPPTTPAEVRFARSFARGAADACWIWEAGTRGNELGDHYGRFNLGSRTDGSRRTVGAHRYAYELAYGPIPEGFCVCHACDTPLCVNPAHLFAGTHGDNARDRDQKGRRDTRPGSRHHNAKLTDAEVARIRDAYGPPSRKRWGRGCVTHAALAKQFGVSRQQVGAIIAGTTWRAEPS